MVTCLAESRPFELHGDETPITELRLVDDAVEATIAAMERGAPGSTFNVEAEHRSVDARGDRDARPDRDAAPRDRPQAAPTAMRPEPRPIRRAFARRWAGSRRPRSTRASRLNGAGPLLGSRPHKSSKKSRRGATSPQRGSDSGAGDFPSAASSSAPSSASRSRSRVARSGAAQPIVYLGPPFAPLGGGQIKASRRTRARSVRSSATRPR